MVDNLGTVISNNRMFNTILHDSGLKVAHLNAQSLVPNQRSSKFDEVKYIFQDSVIDVIGVFETWYSRNVTDTSVNIPGYNIHRNDREIRRGGGVCLYISQKFKSRVIYQRMVESVFESLFVEIIVGHNCSILIGVIYLPNLSFNVCENELCDISAQYNNVIMMGDFNVDLFSRAEEVYNFCNHSSLSLVHNSQPTHYCNDRHSTSLIDYFLVSNIEEVSHKGQFQLPVLNSNHAIICISVNLEINSRSDPIFYRDYKSFNLNHCISDLRSLDFSPIYTNYMPDVQISFFNAIVYELYNNHIPLRQLKKRNPNDWINHPDVKAARENRDLAFRAMRENRSENTVRNYCILRNRLKSIIRKTRRRFYINFFSNCDQGQIWKRLRSVGAIGDNQNNLEIDPNTFNEYARMPRVQGPVIAFDRTSNNLTGFSFRNVNVTEVLNALLRLKSNAVGADMIPLKFLKLIFPEIVTHLTFIINSCITRSYFPLEWKVGRIVPVPKVKNPISVEDFRPISILSCCSKIFEILLKDQMDPFLEEFGAINSFQSGFRKGFNTSTLMLGITESIRENLDKHLVSVLVFLDLNKAFDSLCHELIAKKLIDQFGFSILSSKLLYSFLSNRSQYVRVGNQCSNLLSLYRGVPQGSILGPLLFLLYINDIFTIFSKFKCYTYADDIQLLASSRINNLKSFERDLNIELDNVVTWSRQNFLDLNPNKCKVMFFSGNWDCHLGIFLNGESIESVSTYKSLGFHIDHKLTFSHHINSIISKVSWTLRRLYNTSCYLPLAMRRRVGVALCIPIFLYGLEMYSCTSRDNLARLKLCLNRVIRYVFGLQIGQHISAYRMDLLGYDFEDYISSRQIILFFKIIKYNCPSYLADKFIFGGSTRSNTIVYPMHSTLIMHRSFIMKVARIWNTIIPYTERRFSHSVAQFENIFKMAV
ncbi:RNA-directed DNA polymerase from mobile element jockey [Lucilia cuprina]|nr:RNA-directed DNA polymerase from mobile element jockey [Lucilia cuprina]